MRPEAPIKIHRGTAIKQLVVIRHAKSSWDDPSLKDQDRPLNPRGLKDAPRMGGLLKAWGYPPDHILSSPALRATTTADLIAAAVDHPATDIEIRGDLYEEGTKGLMSAVHDLDDRWHRVYLIGHNPDLTDLINDLSDAGVSHLPTTGIAILEFEVDAWQHIMEGSGHMLRFEYPKGHPEGS